MSYRSNEIDFRINKNHGVGLLFEDDKGISWVTLCSEYPRKAYLNISSWVGIGIGAIHYYAAINIHALSIKNLKTGKVYYLGGGAEKFRPKQSDSIKIEIVRKLAAKDFKPHSWNNPKGDRFDGYKIGDYTNCLYTKKSAMIKAKLVFKRVFAPGWVLVQDFGSGKVLSESKS